MATTTTTASTNKFTPLGWAVMLLFLYVVSKSSAGHDIILYGLILILVFLVITHYKEIGSKLVK